MLKEYPVDAAVIPSEEVIPVRASPAGPSVEFLLENPKVWAPREIPFELERPSVVEDVTFILFAETAAVPPVDP